MILMSTLPSFKRCGLTSFGGDVARAAPFRALPERRSVPEFQHMEKGAVVRLRRRGPFPLLEVESGVVWLTETPAQGDILLRAGSKHILRGCGPVVLQALESAVIRQNVLQPLS